MCTTKPRNTHTYFFLSDVPVAVCVIYEYIISLKSRCWKSALRNFWPRSLSMRLMHSSNQSSRFCISSLQLYAQGCPSAASLTTVQFSFSKKSTVSMHTVCIHNQYVYRYIIIPINDSENWRLLNPHERQCASYIYTGKQAPPTSCSTFRRGKGNKNKKFVCTGRNSYIRYSCTGTYP